MEGGKMRVDSRRTGSKNNNNPVIDQIMLKFRPIAPKPVTGENSVYEPVAKDLQTKRVKRKYVRSTKKKKNKATNQLAINDNQLAINDDSKSNWFDLDRTHVQVVDDSNGKDPVNNWISFDLPGRNRMEIINNLFSSDQSESDLVDPVPVVESWITVESVTGTCEDRELLGYTDEEIWKNLEHDSCPGFISNGYDEVQWVNPTYRNMLDLNSETTEVTVRLVVKVDKSTVVKYLPAFTCRVRIEFRSFSDQKMTRMMVPCDVCRMNSGGFAWWLDVKFALSLGLSG